MTTNVDTDERDTRYSALDAFASGSGNVPAAAPLGGAMMVSGDRVFGAQNVAVHRDEGKVLQRLKALASAAGDDWYYRFPVKNNKTGTTSFVEGASIKLANDLARLYGNCEVDTRVQDLGDAWLIYARFTDFETGFTITRPFQQRKNQSTMGGDKDRALDIAFQIGVSKAMRNVTVNALQTFADFAFDEAKNSLVDKIGKNLQAWRDRIAVRLQEAGIDLLRVEAAIGRKNQDWLAPDIAKIVAMAKAIADGMATKDETFPPIAGETEASASGKKAASGIDKFADGKEGSGKKTLVVSDDPKKRGHSSAMAEADKVVTESGVVIKDKDGETGIKESAAPDGAKDGAGHPSGHEAGHQPAASADSPAAEETASPEPEEDLRPEEVQVAEARGRDARQKGRPKTMLPEDYKVEGREAERDAWLFGHLHGGK